MSLPAPGNPISANMINVEAQRTGTNNAALSVNAIPVPTSLVGLYVSSGVNQVAPHAYSEFYSKTYVTAASPYWFINTTNIPSIGNKYYLGPSNIVIQDPSAPLPSTLVYNSPQTRISLDQISPIAGYTPLNQWSRTNGSGIAIDNDETLVIGGSYFILYQIPSTGPIPYVYSMERNPLLTCHSPATGFPDISTAYKFTKQINRAILTPVTWNHWVTDMQFIDGFESPSLNNPSILFWTDQVVEPPSEYFGTLGTPQPPGNRLRNYGVVYGDVSTSTPYPVPPIPAITYPKLYQHPLLIKEQILDSHSSFPQLISCYLHSSPKVATINFSRAAPIFPVNDPNKAYIYIVEQLIEAYDCTFFQPPYQCYAFNMGITRLTFESSNGYNDSFQDTFTSLIRKVYSGSNSCDDFSSYDNPLRSMSTFADICVIPFNQPV